MQDMFENSCKCEGRSGATSSSIGICGSVVLDYALFGLRRSLSLGFVLPLSDSGKTSNNGQSPREDGDATDAENAPKRSFFSLRSDVPSEKNALSVVCVALKCAFRCFRATLDILAWNPRW